MTTEQSNNENTLTGVIVHVVDYTSGDPVGNAEVTAKKKSGTDLTKTVKRTNVDGMAVFFPLDPVEYNYEITIDGYDTVSGTFLVYAGVMTQVTVRLRKS